MKQVFACLLFILLLACGQRGPIDLEALEGRARGGEAAAFRELVSLLAVKEKDVSGRAYSILTGLGQPAIPYLRDEIATADTEKREHVIAALGNLKDKEAVPTIGRVLGDRTLGRRYVAAWALGEIGAPAGIGALMSALDDDDAEVRRYATRSLIKLNLEAVEPLISFLSEASPRAAAGAVRALGDIGDRRAAEPLLTQISGVNRRDVFLALGKLKDPRAEAALLSGLTDADWQVRMNAAMALGPIGGAAAAQGLTKTLEDDVMVVREWSARSLEMMTGKRFTYRNAKGEQVLPYTIYH